MNQNASDPTAAQPAASRSEPPDAHQMPTWPEVNLPFPLRRNPNTDAVRERTRAWAISRGMLPTDAARRWWDHVDLTALEAWCFPDAPADRLLLIDKWLSMGIMLDDQFDSTPLGHQLGPSCRVVNHMITIIDSPHALTVADVNPFSLAVTDLLDELGQLMTPTWLRRHRHHLSLWWSGIVQAVEHRQHQRSPMSSADRLVLRRLTVGMHAYTDLFEIACDWEFPPALLALSPVRRARVIVTDITIYLNDLYSVERERADGNDDNVLLAWEAEGLTAHTARARAAKLIHDLSQEFINATAELSTSVQTAAQLSTIDRDGLQRWISTCAHYLRGASHSQAIIPRYTDTASHIAHDHHLAAAIRTSG